MSKSRKMPERFMSGQSLNTTMGELFVDKGYGENDLFGFILPSFQRGSVWNIDQQIKFIESIWLELPIGTYMINVHPDLDFLLLDGQQRLRAIKDYTNDEFKVFEYFYSETTKLDKRRFRMLPFPRIETRESDIEVLKEIYNRFNFGGTPHKENERAT